MDVVRGRAFCSITSNGQSDYRALGPFSAGSIIRRISIDLSVTADAGGSDIQFGATAGGGIGENIASFLTGVSLVDRSDQLIGVVPSLRWFGVAEFHHRSEVYPGFEFQTGAGYVICSVVNASVSASATVNVAVEAVRRSSRIVVPAVAVGGAA